MAAFLQANEARLRGRVARALFACARTEAEDLVAEVIADIWCGRFDSVPEGECRLFAFAGGILRNRALHANRGGARHLSLDCITAATNGADLPWALAERVVRSHAVHRALERLPARQRQVARLHWLEQYETPEIAEVLGISVRTVKELLRRARGRLRADLQLHRGSPTRQETGR
ncbi:MAG: RNA polymerase sigma factor [Gemmatimonadaceae bacterium]